MYNYESSGSRMKMLNIPHLLRAPGYPHGSRCFAAGPEAGGARFTLAAAFRAIGKGVRMYLLDDC